MDGLDDVQRKAVERGSRDFLFFCRYFLPEYFKCEPAEFHRDLSRLVTDASLKNVVIAAPRYHGKSTLFSIALPIWCVCYNKYTPLLLISATLDLAELWVKNIKTEFEVNEIIIEHFGDIRGEVWSANELWFANGYRIRARGRGQQIRGWHYGIVVADDLEDDELVRSDTQMFQFRDWFDRGLYNTLDSQAKLYYIGTMLAPNCFLKELLGKGNWHPKLYQAYKDGIEREGNELFPAKWNHEALQSNKANNPYAFAMEFMNQPVPEEDKRIKPEWVQFFEDAPAGLRVFTTIDPSISTKRRADKTAIVTCGIAPSGDIYVLDVYNEINDPYALTEAIFRINRLYAPYKLGVEVVAFQKMLKFWLIDKARERNIYLPIEELKTDTKTTKQLRICGLIPYFAEKKIFLKRGQYALLQQIREFGPSMSNHDDALDALAYQVQLWLKPGYTNVSQKLTGEEWMKAASHRALQDMFSGADEKPIQATGYRSNFFVGK